MFKITDSMLDYWNKDNKPKATSIDIERIETSIGCHLSKAYIEFVKQFGFVVFGRDLEKRYHFDYFITYPDRTEIHEGNIRFLIQTDKLLIAYDALTTTEFNDDEDFPKFPRNYLPVGNDAGTGQILLELGEHVGRVWYWSFNEWAWGTEDNTWLGFVADDFYAFINQLRP